MLASDLEQIALTTVTRHLDDLTASELERIGAGEQPDLDGERSVVAEHDLRPRRVDPVGQWGSGAEQSLNRLRGPYLGDNFGLCEGLGPGDFQGRGKAGHVQERAILQ